MAFNVPDFGRRRRKLERVEFVAARSVFKPQVEVCMTRDVSGWADRGRKLKYSLKRGVRYMVDEQTATEFMVKGYATGELPRKVSDDEAAEIRSVMRTVGVGSG